MNMDLSPLQKISQQGDGETLGDVGLIYPFSDHNRWPLQGADLSEKKDDSVSIISVNSPRQRR